MRYHRSIPYFPALAVSLAVALLQCGPAAPPLHAEGNPTAPVRKPRPGPGFVAVGEVQDREERALSIVPWAQRLPARVGVAVSTGTRFLRQRKGAFSEIEQEDLVLVVEQPPNANERKSQRAWEAALKKRRLTRRPERVARVRALLRCWKSESDEVSVTDRQAARALLTGALPFFGGSGRSGARPPADNTPIVVGSVASVEPFSLRTANGTVHYTMEPDILVVNHELETWDEVKEGQTVLIHGPIAPEPGANVAASIVAISPKPRLTPERERRLILRKRKREFMGTE